MLSTMIALSSLAVATSNIGGSYHMSPTATAFAFSRTRKHIAMNPSLSQHSTLSLHMVPSTKQQTVAEIEAESEELRKEIDLLKKVLVPLIFDKIKLKLS